MKEINHSGEEINRSQPEKLKSLREYVVSSEGQREIVSFIEDLRSEVGNQKSWENTCLLADTELLQHPVNEETIKKFNQSFSLYIDQTPPGHDKGHLLRDLLASLYLNHSTKDQICYQSDASAGLLAGIYHDIGTSIIPRYLDNKFGAGHAETGSFLFWQISEGILGENTRKLVSYAIAAHTHYLKDIKVEIPQDYIKRKYWDDISQNKDGKLIGAAVQLTRRSDRTDTNGVNLIFRHINAHMDTAQSGGYEYQSDQWVEMNRDSLLQVLNPIIRETATPPLTTLEHVLRFAKSNDGTNPYSEKDYLFPGFKKILSIELNQLNGFISSINDHSLVLPEESPQLLLTIKDFLYKISKSNPTTFEQTWSNFEKVWSSINEEQKQRWYKGLLYAKTAYNDILDFYQEELKSSDFSELSLSTIEFLRN